MKTPAALLLALLPIATMAQAVIVDFDRPPDEASLQHMERHGTAYQKQQARAYRHQAQMDALLRQRGLPTRQERMQASMAAAAEREKTLPAAGLPTFSHLLLQMQAALKEVPMHLAETLRLNAPAHLSAPLTRQPLLEAGCTLAASTPSGVELRAGGLNGNRSLYRCDGFYLMAYEWDYSQPLRGGVTIDASGYEKHPGSQRYKVREMSFPTPSGATETMLSWISPGYQMRFEVYTPAGRPQFSPQLDRLAALIEAVAARQIAEPGTGEQD